jgi:hypothetical protein
MLLSAVSITTVAISASRLGLTVSVFPSLEDIHQIQAVQPSWMRYMAVVQQVRIWSELVVMLTNERRGALHDFISGTVVIRRRVKTSTASDQSFPIDGGWGEGLPRPSLLYSFFVFRFSLPLPTPTPLPVK